jgi:hypothetical protein
MINEVYLYLLNRLDHHEACVPARCVASCDVAGFLAYLEAPLLLADLRRQEQERERLAALVNGEIPEAV